MRFAIAPGMLLAALVVAAPPCDAIRLKDIAAVKGVRGNQMIGYGLVVGLNGTGDKRGTEFTIQSLTSMLARLGVGVDPNLVQVKNVAAVVVTSELPPFARAGSKIDLVASSLGDAVSLEGGTLLATPLFGTDGEVYAIAQGPLSVGGFSAGGGGNSVQKNHPTVGRIAQGAIVERELDYRIDGAESFELALGAPDFTTAERLVAAIETRFGPGIARAADSGTVRVEVPATFGGDVVPFLAALEGLEVEPDRRARVVVNERTGTVVIGSDVRIARVAVSHGSLAVTVSTTRDVSQPAPFSDGVTTPVENSDVLAVEEEASLSLVDGVTVEELVRGLNAIGATPRDLIAILQAIRSAGALSAELEVM